jgi:hypothetical protein
VGDAVEEITALNSRPSGVEVTLIVEGTPGAGLGEGSLVGVALGVSDGLALGLDDGDVDGVGLALGLASAVGVVPAVGPESVIRLPLEPEVAAGAGVGAGGVLGVADGVTVGLAASDGLLVGSGLGVGVEPPAESSVVPPKEMPPSDFWKEVDLKSGVRNVTVYEPTVICASLVDGLAVEIRTCLSLAFWPKSQPATADAVTSETSIGCQLPLESS